MSNNNLLSYSSSDKQDGSENADKSSFLLLEKKTKKQNSCRKGGTDHMRKLHPGPQSY